MKEKYIWGKRNRQRGLNFKAPGMPIRYLGSETMELKIHPFSYSVENKDLFDFF